MCGIAGIWNLESPDAATPRLQAMLTRMRHRGPDGQGILQYPGGAAGMVRLALVDLSDRGQQPIYSADRRTAILFNGEIYNFRVERSRLEARGYRFQSHTDTEVILALYLEHGLKFVDRLRGMFALAIFDWRRLGTSATPDLVLVRGPLGIKPLYVCHPNDNYKQVIFASELRGLLASGLVPRRVNNNSLADFLTFGFLVQPGTMISGVRNLDAGTIEVYRADQPTERRVFWVQPPSEPREETLDEAAERLRAVLDESVRLHSLADAPVGAFLSGGVDSTGVTGLMRKHNNSLRTYTLRFPELPGADESQEAEEAARRFECVHTTCDVTAADILPQLPRFAAELDQPSVDGINTWLISRFAAQDVKGVLSGVGGDEWFAGYNVTRRMSFYGETYLGKAQASLARVAHQFVDYAPSQDLRRRVTTLSSRMSPFMLWCQPHSVFRHGVANRATGSPSDETAESYLIQIMDSLRGNWRTETAVGLSCLLDTQVYLKDQLLRDSDATSMASSLELRVPLVDLEVANFSRTCMDEHKLSAVGGTSNEYARTGAKKVLIHALRDILPPGLARRQKKGFVVPLAHWLKNDWQPYVREICNEEVFKARGLVDPSIVTNLWNSIDQQGQQGMYPQMWALLVFELWCRAVLDPPLPSVA
jgi:asparagine synthase (glutamine-hydrolysing)